ncbi:MAG: NACHT domain-containing protein [Candidatus Poribacteria bacterium]|nr:NACHT domain-containing protein [Candidatus Poribacteria bacterium]
MAKRWFFLLLMFLVLINVSNNLEAQEASPDAASKPSEAGEPSQPIPIAGKLTEFVETVRNWINEHTELTLLLGLIIFIVIWFKDKIRRAIANGLKPLFGELITWVFVRFGAYNALLNKYRQVLQGKLKNVGLTQSLLGEGVDLDRNYIPIQLSKEEYRHLEGDPSANSTDGSQTRPSMEEAKMERAEVEDVLANEKNYGNRIAIIGDPGSGKTTLLQYLAYQCTKGDGVRPIPALITLSAYVQHEALSILAYLEVLFEENGFPNARNFLDRQLKRGNWLILFDGFDEVEISKRGELRQQIKAFANHAAHLQNKFVITSRPVGDAIFDDFRHLEVMPLTPQQRRTFLESKTDEGPGSDFNMRRCNELVESFEEHDRIRKLAENPLLLTFLYHVYKYNLELPRRRVELYRLSINLMLDWDMETNRPTHIQVKDRDAKKEVLKRVAYYYHINNRRELPEEELYAQVRQYLPDSLREKFTAKALIQEIENSSGILRHRTAETYQFIHLTFQEYLTADYINDNREVELAKLMTNLKNPWWREVTLLLASTMGNGTPLVYRILDYGLSVTEESERFSCLFIAFNCLFEAAIDADARNKVLDAFIKLPYNQVLDVIQEIVGPFEAENEELETLFVNILNSPHESVQAWGLGFLSQYSHVAEKSERLTKRLQEISYQACQKLPDELQVHILGAIPFEEITDRMWRALTMDAEVVTFDYFYRLLAGCAQISMQVETHQKLLLTQSAQLIRFLIGGISLGQLEGNAPSFTPDRKPLPSSPDFTTDFVSMWPGTIPRFINVLRGLILTLHPDEEKVLDLVQDLDRAGTLNWAQSPEWTPDLAWGRARSLARVLNRAQDVVPDLGQDLETALSLALERAWDRASDGVQFLAQARNLKRAQDLARARARNPALSQTWELALDLVQSEAQELDQTRTYDLAPDLETAMELGLTLARARSREIDREAVQVLALTRDLILACATLHATEQIQESHQSIRFIQRFLETTGGADAESSWYVLTTLQQIHAAPFVNPDSELLTGFEQLWEHRSDAPEIVPYQTAFFVNLATLLHTLGVTLDGLFFEKALAESANSPISLGADLVLRASYLLYLIVAEQATEEEREEFAQLLQTDGPANEREWLELSGLTQMPLPQATPTAENPPESRA